LYGEIVLSVVEIMEPISSTLLPFSRRMAAFTDRLLTKPEWLHSEVDRLLWGENPEPVQIASRTSAIVSPSKRGKDGSSSGLQKAEAPILPKRSLFAKFFSKSGRTSSPLSAEEAAVERLKSEVKCPSELCNFAVPLLLIPSSCPEIKCPNCGADIRLASDLLQEVEFSAQLLLGHDAEDAIKTGITPEGFDIVCHVQNTGVQEVGPSGKVMDEHVIIAENSLVGFASPADLEESVRRYLNVLHTFSPKRDGIEKKVVESLMIAAFQHIMTSTVGTISRFVILDDLQIYADEQPDNPETTSTCFRCKLNVPELKKHYPGFLDLFNFLDVLEIKVRQETSRGGIYCKFRCLSFITICYLVCK